MSTSRLTQHYIVLVVMAVLTIGVVGVLRWFVLYLHREEHALLVAHQRIASYDQNKKIFADETLALTELTTRVRALESYTVTPASTPTLLSSLEALATEHGIEFAITTVQNPGKQKTEKLVVDFSASGNMKNIDAFLEALSHQTYQIKFNKISLFADRTEEGTWNTLGSIQIMSFGI